MNNLEIFCTSIQYLKILDKLPKYIKPLGLGESLFPDHWLDEKKGENISHLNKFYGELTGIYWIWKNRLKDLNNKSSWVGICHYRKLWLNNCFQHKRKLSAESLYSGLLREDNKLFQENDVLQVQPIIFKNKSLLDDFKEIHKTDALEECLNFLDEKEKEKFKEHLEQKSLYPLNMFITKTKNFEDFCKIIFPWLEKCLIYCKEKSLCKDYNTRLPAFLAERFTSYWFSQFNKKDFLSYARMGNFFLSNNINSFMNPIKLPFTLRMYPTIHKY